MSGNGVPILGMTITMAHRQMEVFGNLAEEIISSCGVVRGSSVRGTAVRRIVAGTMWATGTATSVFGLFAPRRGLLNPLSFCPLLFFSLAAAGG